jgi:urease subunit gamma/beta
MNEQTSVAPDEMVPGELLLSSEPIMINAGKEALEVAVTNTGDRPIQVGSHFHFFEVNRALRFDRAAAYGHRLDIPAGAAVRFEPGESRPVRLVALGGAREVWGCNGLVQGALDAPGAREAALTRMRERGFADTGDTTAEHATDAAGWTASDSTAHREA